MAGDKCFGEHLQKIRLSKNLSQEQLAELVGVEYQTISRIETGLYFTSIENLKKIASALDVKIKDLFDYTEKDYTKNELIKIILNELKYFELDELEIIHKLINLYNESKYRYTGLK